MQNKYTSSRWRRGLPIRAHTTSNYQ